MKKEIYYAFNNIIYKVIGSEELHDQLQNDSDAFQKLISSNKVALEIQAPAPNDVQDLNKESWTWNKKSILLLLDSVEKRKLELRDPKIKKKDLWRDIKDELIKHGLKSVNDEMVERKFRNMKGTYRIIKDNKKRGATGRREIKWEYFEIMERILADDKTVNNEHTVSSLSNSGESVFMASTSTSPVANLATLTDDQSTPLESPTNTHSTLPSPNVSMSSVLPVVQSPTSSAKPFKRRKQKAERGKPLYGLQKKQNDVEENRVRELQLLREAIEENNRIQAERNELFKRFLEKKKILFL